MRVNWFSPLRPARSGIAEYTALLLPLLRAHGDVTLWTDQPSWDKTLEKASDVRRYSSQHPPWREWNDGNINIYNLGNSHAYHKSIWLASRRCAGLVILHDLSLQHFFVDLCLNDWRDEKFYTAAMKFYYGEPGHRAAAQYLAGTFPIDELAAAYPLTGMALENALGVLVHTPKGLDDVAAAARMPAAYVPLPYEPHQMEDSRAPVGPPFRLIIFGVIGPNRRLDEFLRAWAGMPERDQFRLEICGELWDSSHVKSLARALGLKGLITLSGYVPEDVLHAQLARSHLAVNLRFPSMGEASLTLLQIWAHGLPALVTATGWYHSIPTSAAAFVRPEFEIDDIRQHLRNLLLRPEEFARIGKSGRRTLHEEHGPRAYVESLLHFVSMAWRSRARLIREHMADRVGAELRRWMPAGLPRGFVSRLATTVCSTTAPAAETK